MARYSVSGANTTILDATVDATGGSGDPTALLGGQAVLGSHNSGNITSGRVLWLRSFWAYNPTTVVSLALFDASVAVNPTGSTRRAVVRCASGATTMIDFPAPGLKFATGCVVSKEATDASGAFDAGYVGGAGYEEG